MSTLRALALLAFTILLVAPAEATTSYYQGSSGETQFNTAVGGLTLLDPGLTFSAGDLGSGGLFNASGTGINFLGFDDFTFNNPLDFSVTSGRLIAQNTSQVVKITFPASGIYAFGIHITTVSGAGNWCIDVTSTGCANTVFNSGPTDIEFFGVVSGTPITAPLYIRSTITTKLVLTNFEAFSGASTPESGANILVGLGLVILPLIQRRLFRKP